MANLLNVYTQLKIMFENSDFLYAPPVSYLKTLTDSNEKVLFIYKQGKSINLYDNYKEANVKYKKELEDDTTVNPDIIGTPLEDNCAMPNSIDIELNIKISNKAWTDLEECYSCVTLERARLILTTANMEYNCDSGSIWTLCDATDEENTILLQTEFDKNWNYRGIVYFTGLVAYTEVDINVLLQKHFSYIQHCHKVNTEIETFFNIHGDMILKLAYSTTSLLPLLNSYKNAEIILYQTIKIGNINSRAFKLWEQLEILEIVRENIETYKVNPGRCDFYITYKNENKIDTIKEQIMITLSEVTTYTIDEKEHANDIEAVISRAVNRNYMDLTDQLWTILKFCNTYDDLKSAFNFIFQCAAKCNIVNMPTNQNRLAELIREISRQRIAVPCLTGTEPLELLLEIGLQKITKDYEYIFTESKICSKKDLCPKQPQVNPNIVEPGVNIRKSLCNAITQINPTKSRTTLMHKNEADTAIVEKIGFQNSYYNSNEVNKELARLAQIHMILEHLLLMQTNLKLDNIYFSLIDQLQKPTKSFHFVKSMMYDKREIPILNNKILTKIEGHSPHAQKIVMTSENKFKKIKNTFYFSVDPIFPTNVFPNFKNDDPKLSTLFSGIHYLKLGTRRN